MVIEGNKINVDELWSRAYEISTGMLGSEAGWETYFSAKSRCRQLFGTSRNTAHPSLAWAKRRLWLSTETLLALHTSFLLKGKLPRNQ